MSAAENIETEWVEGLKQGHAKVFDVVYEAYRKRLYGFLWRMTQDRDLATDLYQETWLRVVQKAAELKADTRLGPWIFTIARNLCRSHYRWSVVDEGRKEALRSSSKQVAFETPYQLVTADETQTRIEVALAGLPLPYREALLLFLSGDFTSEECAELLELTPQTFRKRLSRARQRIADILD